MSQLCAYCCIHVPIVDPSAANQTIRKFRWASAATMRCCQPRGSSVSAGRPTGDCVDKQPILKPERAPAARARTASLRAPERGRAGVGAPRALKKESRKAGKREQESRKGIDRLTAFAYTATRGE